MIKISKIIILILKKNYIKNKFGKQIIPSIHVKTRNSIIKRKE